MAQQPRCRIFQSAAARSGALTLAAFFAMNACNAQFVDAGDYAKPPSKEVATKPVRWQKQGSLPIYFVTTRLNEAEKDKPSYGFRRHLDLGDGSSDFGLCRLTYPSGLQDLSKAKNGTDYKELVKQNSKIWANAKTRSCQTYKDAAELKSVIANWRGTICVYTHGYDISFDESVRDLAVICAELENRQPDCHILPILFSWPSMGARTEYSSDQANLAWSEKPLFDFLDQICKEKSPAAKLDLIAHSMGCQAIFHYCQKTPPATTAAAVRNIFLCSADVDFHYAEQHKREVEDSASNMVYVLVSDKDGPLIMSEYLHGQPRLGRPIDPPKFTRQRAELAQSDYWLQVAGDALDLVRRNGMNDAPEVQQWLESNPSLDREYGEKAKLIDVSEVMSESVGHALAWPVVAGLMCDKPTLLPLPVSIVHKKPDRSWLQRCNGRPFCLYRFTKVDVFRLNGASKTNRP